MLLNFLKGICFLNEYIIRFLEEKAMQTCERELDHKLDRIEKEKNRSNFCCHAHLYHT
jgi:hypothetical protein